MTLVQIVPALSPPANGVGDYALGVARALRSHAIESAFLVCSPRAHAGAEDAPFRIEALEERTPAAFVRSLQSMAGEAVLLQFSPYGYEPNGCPFWLAAGLRQWAQARPGRLVTMFHELYAGGPPWSRAFWVAGLQKRAIRQVLGCTDLAITNTRRYATELKDWSRRPREVHCLPVPSNVGEPRTPPPLSGRSRRVCMFGISPGQRDVPPSALRALREALRAWSIEEIVLVGESPVPATFRGLGCGVETRRALPAAEVSAVLQDCVAGLLSYPESALAKSGVYAAYSAHRLPTVLLPVPGSGTPSRDGLTMGQHFVDLSAPPVARDASRFQEVADSALAWYRAHTLSAHAGLVARHVAGASPGPA